MKSTRLRTILPLALTVFCSPAMRGADIRIMVSGAFRVIVADMAPAFERATGDHLVIESDTAGALAERIAAGESFDLTILPPSSLEAASVSAEVRQDSSVVLARVGIGVCIRKGSAPPDISTVTAFKETLLASKSIAYIDPASGGSSGIYVDQLLNRLGIAESLKSRI